MAAVAVRRPVAADDMALAALIQACQRKPVLADQVLKNQRTLQPFFTSEDDMAHLKKRNSTPGKDRTRQAKAKKPKASKPQAPAPPVALSVTATRRVAPVVPKPAPAAPTPSKAGGVKLAAEGKQWAGPSSFISPKPEALPKPSLSLLRKASA